MTIDLTKYTQTHGARNGRSYNGAMMDKGKFGENVIMRWLQDFPDVLEVEDYRQLKPLQKADVDCAIYFVEGDVLLAEIKSDKNLKFGGNVTFEYLRVNHTAPPERACTLGWTARTPAKWVLFYAPSEGYVYRFHTDVMRSVFQSYTRDMRPTHGGWFSSLPELKMYWVSTDSIKSTLICCLPLELFPVKSVRCYDVSRYL